MAAWLLAVVVFLIAFGTLYPFSFSLAGSGAGLRFGALPRAGTTYSDVAANVLLYLPLGTCLAWLLAPRLGSTLAVAAATLLGAGLSFAVETAQLFETRRVLELPIFELAGERATPDERESIRRAAQEFWIRMPLDEFRDRFDRIVYFLSRLASCVNTKLCDRAVADEFFLDYARSFWRFFSTYIERERKAGTANLAVGIETYLKAPR